MAIVLASSSPRRKELLGFITPHFLVQPAAREAVVDPALPLPEAVTEVAYKKGQEIMELHIPEDVVISADTVVVCGGQILGKPQNTADAAKMLALLSGKQHSVLTGYCVFYRGQCVKNCVETGVKFYSLTPKEIADYAATGEPLDKAGAYAIQGGAMRFVEHIEGDYFNVIGLPVFQLNKTLREIGVLPLL